MIKYGLIARGSLALSDYSDYEGDFSQIAKKIIAKNKKSDQKQIFQKDEYIFAFYSQNEFTFLAMTDNTSNSKENAFEFLENLKQFFFENYEKQDDDWQKTLTAKMRELMHQQNQQIKTDKIDVLENHLEEVQEIAKQSIDSLLEREVKLDILSDKSKNLSVKSNHLKYNARRLKKKMDDEGFPAKKIYALLIMGFVALVYILIKKSFSNNK